MKGHGENLGRKEEQAIVALLTRPTVTEAAKACAVSEVTLWRWRQRPEFSERYRAARRQAKAGAPTVPHLGVRPVPAALATLLDAGEPHEGTVRLGTP